MTRVVLTALLCLLLGLTSHSIGVARGAERAVGQMVICAGTQAVRVYVEANGEPTDAPHLCPDCVLHGVDLLATDVSVRLAAPDLSARVVALASAILRSTTYDRARARAPPAVM